MRLILADVVLSLFGYGWILRGKQVFGVRNWMVRTLTKRTRSLWGSTFY